MDTQDFGRGSIGINDAYTELTRPGFAVWVRLMTMTAAQHARGRDYIAKQLEYSEPGASGILRELARKGYLKMESRGPFERTKLVLIKRLALKGEDHIIKLG